MAFGADLSASLQPQDNGVSAGNNAEPETLAQVKLVVPANTADLTYALSGTYVPSLEGVGFVGIWISPGCLCCIHSNVHHLEHHHYWCI